MTLISSNNDFIIKVPEKITDVVHFRSHDKCIYTPLKKVKNGLMLVYLAKLKNKANNTFYWVPHSYNVADDEKNVGFGYRVGNLYCKLPNAKPNVRIIKKDKYQFYLISDTHIKIGVTAECPNKTKIFRIHCYYLEKNEISENQEIFFLTNNNVSNEGREKIFVKLAGNILDRKDIVEFKDVVNELKLKLSGPEYSKLKDRELKSMAIEILKDTSTQFQTDNDPLKLENEELTLKNEQLRQNLALKEKEDLLIKNLLTLAEEENKRLKLSKQENISLKRKRDQIEQEKILLQEQIQQLCSEIIKYEPIIATSLEISNTNEQLMKENQRLNKIYRDILEQQRKISVEADKSTHQNLMDINSIVN